MDEGVVVKMPGHEGITVQVYNPVMYLVVTRNDDEATLITVKSEPNDKSDPVAISVAGRVWGFYAE